MSIRTAFCITAILLLPSISFAETRNVCKTGGSGLNVRSSPSIHGRRIGGFSEGARFEMTGLSNSGTWVKVRVNGRTGWVSRDYVCGGSGSSGASSSGGGGGAAAGGGSGAGAGSHADAGTGDDGGENAAGASDGFVNPVAGACRSSSYGTRRDPIHGGTRFHDGTDFAAGNGTPLRSAFSGKVVRAGAMRGYGYAVVVRRDNPDGSSTFALYGHMCCGGRRLGRSSIRVRVGQQVDAGQPIGQVGTTGRSTGPHLHMLMRHVPRGAGASYRNPNASAFFSRRYAVNPENYVQVGGCGGRRGTGGADVALHHDDHSHAGEAMAAGMAR